MSSEDSSLDDDDAEAEDSFENEYREGGIALLFEEGFEDLGDWHPQDSVEVKQSSPMF